TVSGARRGFMHACRRDTIRHALRLDTGDRVAFRLRGDGVVELVPETVDLLSLHGVLKPARRGITIEDMKDAVRRRGGKL
ncbi:hypothetical protein ACFL59_06620, partial [Planctomycetota bacterium]